MKFINKEKIAVIGLANIILVGSLTGVGVSFTYSLINTEDKIECEVGIDEINNQLNALFDISLLSYTVPYTNENEVNKSTIKNLYTQKSALIEEYSTYESKADNSLLIGSGFYFISALAIRKLKQKK